MSDPTPVPVTELPKPPLADIPWLSKPSRKVWVFALSNVLIQWALAFISGRWHFDLASWLQPFVNDIYGVTAPGTAAPGAQAVLATGLAFIIAYLTSPSFSDVYQHLTSRIVARAILDPGKVDVSAPQIAAAVSTVKVEALLKADVKPDTKP